MSAFFSGSLDPFWPHAILLTVAVAASFAVGAGIVLENPRWSLANVLVVGGVAIEAACTILLFGFDEGISGTQQSRIIALDNELLSEQRITARERMLLAQIARAVLPRNVVGQRDVLVAALKGKGLGLINIAYLDKKEPSLFALQLVQIFESAGIMGKLIVLPTTTSVDGSSMYAPTPKGMLVGQILWQTTNMSQTRIAGGASSILDARLNGLLPKGEDCLIIGENDAALQPSDGQPGEGVNQYGRPVPAPQ